jgi:Ca2+-dependent lipid-binding protein
LKITSLKVQDVKFVELFGLDKLDPYLVIELNKKTFTTPVSLNYEKSAVWANLTYEFECDKETVRKGILDIQLWDRNETHSDFIIAYASLPLRKLSTQLNMEEDVDFSAKIVLKAQGVKCGSMVVTGNILPEDSE